MDKKRKGGKITGGGTEERRKGRGRNGIMEEGVREEWNMGGKGERGMEEGRKRGWGEWKKRGRCERGMKEGR